MQPADPSRSDHADLDLFFHGKVSLALEQGGQMLHRRP